MSIYSGSFFIILFGLTDCLSSFGVCKNASTGTLVCCSDFEEVNFLCVPCKIGHWSSTGNPCKVCQYNFYGHHCLYECKCSEEQRCDHVFGCIDITTAIMLTAHVPTENTSMMTHHGPNKDKEKDIKKDKREEFHLSTREKIFYSVSIGCCSVLLSVCCILIKYKQKRYYRQRLQIALQAIQNESNNRRNEALGLHEGAYALIDESNLIDINRPNPYLDVIPNSSNSSVSDNNRSICSGYLNPYQPLAHVSMQSHCEDDNITGQDDDPSSHYANLYQMLTTYLKDTTDDYEKIVQSSGLNEMVIVPAEKRRHSLHFPLIHQCTKVNERPCSI